MQHDLWAPLLTSTACMMRASESIDRETAIRILHVLGRYGEFGEGDIKALGGRWQGYFRLRVGEYRIIFALSLDEITIARVRHE